MRPVQQVTLGPQVANELRELIIRRTLAPGTHLVEDRLAADFGLSRGPIRDSLRQLQKEGLVESRRRGIFVVGLTETDIEDLYSLREAIELTAVQHAMDRADASEWARFEPLIDELRRAADVRDYAAFAVADVKFHTLLYALSRHRRLADVWAQYEPIFSTLLQVTVNEDDDLHPSAEDHQHLLDVIRAGDKQTVVGELSRHLDGAKRRMLQSYVASLNDAPTK